MSFHNKYEEIDQTIQPDYDDDDYNDDDDLPFRKLQDHEPYSIRNNIYDDDFIDDDYADVFAAHYMGNF